MKELFIYRLLGVDIIAREPKDYPEVLKGEPLYKQLNRAKELMERLVKKEFTVPSEEDIIKELLE